jgi:hypothetical protein
MDFRLELSLPDPDGPITVRARSEVIGACPPITVPMPFDAAQTSIVARALDLNASDRLRRWFAPNEAQQLREWGVLYTTPPLGESITISGEDIDREPLRMLVRRRLYACLIEPVKPQLEKHLAYLRGQDGAETLHLRLELWPSELTLFQYPWELLHGDDSLDGQIHISRYILDQRHLPPMSAASRLRLLLLHSEPSDLEALQLADGERIENGLRPTPGAALVDIQHIEKASIEKLDRALAHDRATPTVVHFAGHGDFGRRCQHCKALTLAAGPNCSACGRRLPKGTVPMGFLAFTDDRSGRTHWISAEELRQALSVARVQLVVLNACKTALGRGGGDCFNGIAQRLMKNVPAVVASPYPLENQGAMDFARKLYEGIGAGDTLVEALQRVRARMRYHEDEWYRPVLYLRSVQDGDETGRLLDLQISARVEPVADRWARVRVRMPHKAVFTADFFQQADRFLRLVRAHRGLDAAGNPHPRRSRPMVFLVPGWIDYAAAEGLLGRLIEALAQELSGYDESFRALGDVPLGNNPWDLMLDGSERLARTTAQDATFTDRVLAAFEQHETSVQASLRAAEDPLASLRVMRHREPKILFAHVDLEKLRRPSPVGYVQAFCEFWSGWGDQNQLLLVCLFIGYPACATAPISRRLHQLLGGARRIAAIDRELWRMGARWHRAIGGGVLPTVRPVREAEVRSWAKAIFDNGMLPDGRSYSDWLRLIEDLCRRRSATPGERCVCFRDLSDFWSDLPKRADEGQSA